MSNLFMDALRVQAGKVFTAFFTWGLGMVLMAGYSLLALWLKNTFNVYVMLIGSLAFLTLAYFIIDLWWSYNHLKQLKRVKGL